MRVKRFIGENVAETMGKIKRELGSDAVILQTRQIKEGGFLGFFARTKVEITAAIEDNLDREKIENSRTQALPAVNTEVIKKAYEAYRDKENENARECFKQGAAGSPDLPEQNPLATTQSELKEMHNLLKEIKGHLAEREDDKKPVPEPLNKWADFLTARGVSSELTMKLLTAIKTELSSEQWADATHVFEKLKKQVARLCLNTELIRPRKSRSLVVALIGPTGVGKTTTIGKLAAGFSIIERRKVALITADTYRVAAVEQLKTFGEIIGVPVEVVMTPEDLKIAIDSHQDKELIFIDTAGRSPYHELHMSELEAFLKKAKPSLTMLVLSVTTNLPDQIKVYERFRKLSTHLILTKLDESYSQGAILDILANTDLPVAYLTNGQDVPDDIDAATPEKLTGYVLGEGNPYV